MSGTTTTTVAFTPSTASVFSFNVTLDNAAYTVSILWGLAGQRWYFQILDYQNNLIVYRALVSTPQAVYLAGGGINLLFGYFTTSTMIFVDETQTFVISGA